jgi:hypothetical protein
LQLTPLGLYDTFVIVERFFPEALMAKRSSTAAAAIQSGKENPPSTPPRPRDVTRYILPTTQAMLWGRAAGRCEFAGCNKPLWKSSITQETVNIAQKAHIYSFSSDGPRGNLGVSDEQLNCIDNLMLVCHECHQKIDREQGGGRYTPPLLQTMKADHERRIEIVTGVAANKKSHVLLYGANIGDHSSPLGFVEAAQALFPGHYPAEAGPVALGTINNSFGDRDATFWKAESENLRRLFERRVRERLAVGEIDHLSVFALAPQPLLILLGTLLGDITKVDVYQRHREPQGWTWPVSAASEPFIVREPADVTGPPALVLSLSATVTPDRVESVLGADAIIWTVTIASPDNDFVKCRGQLTQFRSALRPLLDRIKAAHGQTTQLHVFPVAPVSVAVELGRVRMPKADMPWRIYDQVNSLGGFVPALSIPSGD